MFEGNWTEPLKADKYGKLCIQGRSWDLSRFSKNCLFLNVFVPGIVTDWVSFQKCVNCMTLSNYKTSALVL